MRPDYKVIEHPADVGFEVWSASRDRLYADAVLAFFDMIVGADSVTARDTLDVEVEGPDDEDLMVGLLSKCLYLMETRQMLFSEADVVEATAARIHLRCRGEQIDADRHHFDLAVKAITYHDLLVGQDGARWHARVIVDI